MTGVKLFLFIPIFLLSCISKEKPNFAKAKQVIENQSFNTSIEDFGHVRFVSEIDNWIHFSLVRNDSVLYTFPLIQRHDHFDPSIEAVSFYDADKDGRKDVILILKAYSKTGKEGTYYYFNNLFINTGYKTFEKASRVNIISSHSTVNTVDEFKKIIDDYYAYQTVNIGPTRKWKSLNQYFGDKHTRKNNIHVFLDDTTYYDKNAIWIRGKNLIIEGRSNTKLFCESQSENVMWLSGATNVLLKNLQMKHKAYGTLEEFGNCSGRVLAFDVAYDIIVENCNLNGSGLAGLHDNLGNKNILVKNSTIHNCSVGAYTDIDGNIWQAPEEHPVFTFENTEMYNNGPDRLLE